MAGGDCGGRFHLWPEHGHGDRSPQLPALVATCHCQCGSHEAQTLLGAVCWPEGMVLLGMHCWVVLGLEAQGGGREVMVPRGVMVMARSSMIPGLQDLALKGHLGLGGTVTGRYVGPVIATATKLWL